MSTMFLGVAAVDGRVLFVEPWKMRNFWSRSKKSLTLAEMRSTALSWLYLDAFVLAVERARVLMGYTGKGVGVACTGKASRSDRRLASERGLKSLGVWKYIILIIPWAGDLATCTKIGIYASYSKRAGTY